MCIGTWGYKWLINMKSSQSQINVGHFNSAWISCTTLQWDPNVRDGRSLDAPEMHIANLPKGIGWSSHFSGTITLVNYNGILNIVHHKIFIHNVLGFPWIFPNIGFDSCSVGCAYECAVFNSNTNHTLIQGSFTKASHTYSMTRSTCDARDSDVGGTLSYWNAVVTCCNDAIHYSHQIAGSNVHSVCVGTVFRSTYVEIHCCEIVAMVKMVVELLWIYGCNASHHRIIHSWKLQWLSILKSQNSHFGSLTICSILF